MSDRKRGIEMRRDGLHEEPSDLIKKAKPLSQQVTGILLAEIQAGVFQPGDRLPPETELARKYGVSRTIIREALASLKNDDILESRQGRGITIKDPQGRLAFRFSDVFETISQPEVNYLYEMRAILEAEAAGLAALRHTEADRLAIERGYGEMAVAVKEHKPGEEAHFMYNESISVASHNPVLIEFLGFLQAKLRLLAKELRLGTMMSPERATLVLGEHRKIVDAILSRDPTKAREAVLEHLRNAAKRANLQIYAP